MPFVDVCPWAPSSFMIRRSTYLYTDRLAVTAFAEGRVMPLSVHVPRADLAPGEFVLHHLVTPALADSLLALDAFEDTGRTAAYGMFPRARVFRLVSA